MEIEPISITTLMEGAAIEQFNIELQRVIDNALDVNTKATATRKVVLELYIKPDDQARQTASFGFQIKSSLTPQNPMATRGYILRKGNKAVAYEHDPKQLPIFNQPADKPALVDKAVNE